MANVSLTALHGGGAVTVDAALISNINTQIATLTAQQLREAGTTQGTRVSPTGVDPVDVRETVQDVRTIVQASNALSPTQSPSILGGAIFRDGMPAAQQVFNAAGPAPITGLSLTGLVAGNYLFMMSGTADSTDIAACGATFSIAKNGAPIGTVLSSPQSTFGANSQISRGLGQMGLQLQDGAIPTDVYTILVGVVPGGVGGDDITVTDVTLTAIRLS